MSAARIRSTIAVLTATAAVALLGLGGCASSIMRNGIDEAGVARSAVVAGLPGVRFWGDEVPKDFSAEVKGGSGELSYAWDFDGDGVTDSTLLDPEEVTFDAFGEYTLSFCATDALGQSVLVEQRVVVIGPPASMSGKKTR